MTGYWRSEALSSKLPTNSELSLTKSGWCTNTNHEVQGLILFIKKVRSCIGYAFELTQVCFTGYGCGR